MAYGTMGNTSINATQTTFAAANTYAAIGVAVSLVGPSNSITMPTNGNFTINQAGVYNVSYHLSAAALGESFATAIFVNGAIVSQTVCRGHTSATTQSDNTGASAMLSLNVGDVVTLRIANTLDTSAILVQFYSLTAAQME